jgi:acyl-CoA thioesterase-1
MKGMLSVIRFFWVVLSLTAVSTAAHMSWVAAAQPPVILAVEPPVLLVFGDSLSAGYGLPQGKGWVDLLQKKLVDGGFDYRVVNASISGETSLGGRNRFAAALATHKPQIVILELGANDGLRGQPLSDLRDNLVAMIREARQTRAQVVLTGMRIPPNYGPDYTKKFQAVFTEVARAEHVPLVPFLLEGFSSQRDMFQSDGIHPNEQAQRLVLANVWKLLAPELHKAVRPG